MSFVQRLRALWRKIFFWQYPLSTSEQHESQVHDDHALVLAVTNPPTARGISRLRFLFHVFTKKDIHLFWISLGVLVLSLGTLGAALIQAHVTSVPTLGGTYVEGLVGTPKLLNPVYSTAAHPVDADLTALVFSGLFKLNEQFEAVPDLAESFEWLDQGKTLQVVLRKDARFHDGEPLQADDVDFTFKSIKDAQWRSPLAEVFKDVQVLKIDEHTIQFQLTEARPSFLLDLTVGILPAHAWLDVLPSNAQLADLNVRPIGSGPYRVVAFTRDSKGAILHYDLERFEHYYGIKPMIEHLRMKLFADRRSALDELKKGSIDGLAFIAWTDAKELGSRSVTTTQLIFPMVTTIIYNTKDTLLSQPELRKALNKAIQPIDIQGLLDTPTELVNSPYPFLLAASSTQTPNLEEARKELETLGWKLAEGATVRTKTQGSSTTSQELSLRIRVPEQPDLLKVAEALQRFWSLAGARVEIETGDDTQVARETVANRDHQIYLTYLRLAPNQDMRRFWSSQEISGDGLNLSHIANRDVDAALTAIDTATSTVALESARQQFVTTLEKLYPAYFLFRPSYAYVTNSDIKGITSQRIARPSDRFQHLNTWYIDTKWVWR